MIPPYYDSLIAKLIVHGRDRAEAIARMRRALEMFVVEGIKTSIPLHQRIFADPDFIAGRLDTHFLERLSPVLCEVIGRLECSMVFPPLYAIIDAGLLKTSELRFARDLAESGVELLQYRNKHATARELFDASRALALRFVVLAKSASA